MDARRRDLALQRYAQAGYDTLPLRGKDAYFANWQRRASADMWTHASAADNIGIRTGGALHLAVLDCDDKNKAHTSERAARFLAGLGLHRNDYPEVKTPSGGRHFYLALADKRDGAYCNLSPEIGAGEFRFGSGAYVAAPPSEIGEKAYQLAAGDFAKLPRVALPDLAPILGRDMDKPNSAESARLAAAPHLSRRAAAMLRGEGIERYASRSEFEQAIIASLVNSGFEFDEILSLFVAHPCGGKFQELYKKNPRNAARWLHHSFENARQWTAAHESQAQQIARAAAAWANSHAWRGKTGAVDCAVFLAHCEIAERSGRLVYAASCRDLAERAGVNFRTAIRATHRLRALGLIVLEQEATFNLAHTFRIVRTDTLSKYLIVRECVSTPTSAHDVFRQSGLGKTAAAVWDALQSDSLTAKEIIEKTGRSIRAVNRALERMFQLEMVGMDLTERGNVWSALENVDLDEIARKIGTFGTGARQKAEHERDRAARHKLYRHISQK